MSAITDHDHHLDHPKQHVAHHWANAQQQFDASKLGMWLFLATEVLLFGGLFCGYAIWRMNHPELFRFGSHYLDRTMGATNTAVLILSSLTMAWGVTAAQKNQQRLLRVLLILTLAGACTFLVIKYFEYTHKFHDGLFPGVAFYDHPPEHSELWKHDMATGLDTVSAGSVSADVGEVQAEEATDIGIGEIEAPAGATAPKLDMTLPPADAPKVPIAATPPMGVNDAAVDSGEIPHLTEKNHPLLDPARPPNAQMFFNLYFMMTGLHGVHVVVGIILITWLLIRSFRGDFSAEYFTPVDLGGLYWHIVDLIWIFLFPLFYLI